MKLCTECKHHKREGVDTPKGPALVHVCYHPDNCNPVDGSLFPCDMLRQQQAFCGLQGKNWEAKELTKEEPKAEASVIQLS